MCFWLILCFKNQHWLCYFFYKPMPLPDYTIQISTSLNLLILILSDAFLLFSLKRLLNIMPINIFSRLQIPSVDFLKNAFAVCVPLWFLTRKSIVLPYPSSALYKLHLFSLDFMLAYFFLFLTFSSMGARSIT